MVPLGVNPRWFAPPAAGDLTRVRAVHDLPEAYFLFVGTLQPRKNLARVVRAHASLPKALRRAFPLVLVGRMGWGVDDLNRLLAAADSTEVCWLRYLPDAHLLPVVHQARALVFPSLCEGFGLPVVEAFAAGLPVITSNTSALPEVAQDAALLVDPTDGEAIADAMRRLAEDAALATRLRDKGLIRARDFSCRRRPR